MQLAYGMRHPPSYLGLAARDCRGGASFAPPQYQHALESTDHAIPTYRNQLEVSLLDLRISSSFFTKPYTESKVTNKPFGFASVGQSTLRPTHKLNSMSQNLSHHVYDPLISDRTIRLLYLNPAAREEELVARLERVDLGAHPPYEALSYEWGNATKTRSITLESGHPIGITQSLFNALTDLRPGRETHTQRVIWADAICINQDDIDERQQQVSIMSTIYRLASRVITYIGPEAEDSAIAIKFAMHLLSFYCENPAAISDPRLHMPHQVHQLGLPPISDRRWQALKTLLLRGWSSRCWCAHEFLMNKKLLIQCGRQEIPYWRILGNIVQLVVNRELPSFLVPRDDEDPNSLRECLVELTYLRSSIAEGGESLGLLNLLEAAHPFRATDPRDKVYCLLGLARDRDMYAVSVDYTRSAASLYASVAARNITITQSVDLLYSNLPRKTLELPSWVPDWSTWQYGSHGANCRYQYKACGNTKTYAKADESGLKLHVTGCIVGRINWLDDIVIGTYYRMPSHPSRQEWLLKNEQMVESLKQYSHPRKEVLWRTLIGNVTLDEKPATDEYQSNYDAHVTLTHESPVRQHTLAREFRDATRRKSRYRRLCTMQDGFLGAVPKTAQSGDCICMLEGGHFLFILRPIGDEFLFMGPAYVHGLMYGEVLKMDTYERRILTLI
jgi:hypothetical protein